MSAGSAQAAKTMGFTYESPGDPIFTWIQNAGPGKVPYVIINAPNNGNLVSGDTSYLPTTSWSPSLGTWTALSATLHSHGIKVICYVDSAFTNRPVWQVENDMSQYLLDGFTVDGFFVDDVAWGWSATSGDGSGTTHGTWYTNLYNFVHTTMPSWNNPKLATSPIVINNPGGIGDVSNWMNTCDLNVIFEGPYTTFTANGTTFNGYTSWSPSGTWVMNYPTSRFINLVTNVGSTSIVDTLYNGAAAKHAGYLYTTNVSCDWHLYNTYGTDPSTAIWNEEILKSQ